MSDVTGKKMMMRRNGYLGGADEGLGLVLDLSELLDLLIALLLQLGLLQHTVNVPLGETAVGLDLHCTPTPRLIARSDWLQSS